MEATQLRTVRVEPGTTRARIAAVVAVGLALATGLTILSRPAALAIALLAALALSVLAIVAYREHADGGTFGDAWRDKWRDLPLPRRLEIEREVDAGGCLGDSESALLAAGRAHQLRLTHVRFTHAAATLEIVIATLCLALAIVGGLWVALPLAALTGYLGIRSELEFGDRLVRLATAERLNAAQVLATLPPPR